MRWRNGLESSYSRQATQILRETSTQTRTKTLIAISKLHPPLLHPTKSHYNLFFMLPFIQYFFFLIVVVFYKDRSVSVYSS